VRTDGDDEGENESSNGVFELNRRCLLSTSFRDELKNFAKVEIVEIYEEKYTKCLTERDPLSKDQKTITHAR
jgi:hypothetical protein